MVDFTKDALQLLIENYSEEYKPPVLCFDIMESVGKEVENIRYKKNFDKVVKSIPEREPIVIKCEVDKESGYLIRETAWRPHFWKKKEQKWLDEVEEPFRSNRAREELWLFVDEYLKPPTHEWVLRNHPEEEPVEFINHYENFFMGERGGNLNTEYDCIPANIQIEEVPIGNTMGGRLLFETITTS